MLQHGHGPATSGSVAAVDLVQSSLVKLHQLLAALHSHAATTASFSGAASEASQLGSAITLTTELYGWPTNMQGECTSCATLQLQLHAARTQTAHFKSLISSDPAAAPETLQRATSATHLSATIFRRGSPDSASQLASRSQTSSRVSTLSAFRDSASSMIDSDDDSPNVIGSLSSAQSTAPSVKRQGSDLHIITHAKRPRVVPAPLVYVVPCNADQAPLPDPALRLPPLPSAESLDMAALFASLPSLPPSPATAPFIRHTTPSALHADVDIFTRNHRYRTRYDSTGTLLTHACGSLVIHHKLLPVRPLDACATATYLAFLHQNTLFKYRSPAQIIDILLPRGLGVHMSHGQLYSTMTMPNKSRNILYAFNRPTYLVGTAARDTRPDLWDALVASALGRSIEISEQAVLALLLSVECVGLEEPTAETHVPSKLDRLYCVRERIAIVEMRKERRGPRSANASRDAHDEDSGSGSGDEEDADHEAADDDEDDVEMDAAYLAFPPALIPTGPTPGTSRPLRYVSGRLQVYSNESVLAHELLPAGDIPADLKSKYLANATPGFRASCMPLRVFQFAMRRGPTQPFSLQAIKQGLTRSKVELGPETTLLNAIRLTVSRPLFVVDELDGDQHRQVRQRLAEAAIRESGDDGQVPQEARLVMLLGLEVVGLELPRESDPVPADRLYVVRERYALIV